MKIARKWRDLSRDEQINYLKRHRKSKRRPTSPIESEEISEIKKSMGKLNSMVEGKEHIVKEQANKWIEKLQNLGFKESKQIDNEKFFEKENAEAIVGIKKGTMRYIAYFEIKQKMKHFAKIQFEFINYARR